MATAFQTAVEHLRDLAAGSRTPADADLLRRFASGHDDRAFAALVARYGSLVFATCKRVLGDAHLAEDCSQATFLALARQANTLHGRSSLVGWLYVVALRNARKSCNRHPHLATLSTAVKDKSRDPLEELSGRELCAALDQELGQLPERYRDPILLCCLEGLTRDEAARRLAWTLNSVRGRLERGRTLLRKRLEKRGLALSSVLSAGLLPFRNADAMSPALLRKIVSQIPSLATASALRTGSRPRLVGRYAASTALMLTLVTGTGLWVIAAQSLPATSDEQPLVAQSGDRPPDTPPASSLREDVFGDPLPEGAVARMGTVRLHHAVLGKYAFTPDSRRIVSVGDDQTLRFWDPSTGRQVRSVRLQGKTVLGWLVTFSPDARFLAAQDSDGVVIWETESGKELRRLSMAQGHGAFFCFSPDSKILAEGFRDAKLALWQWRTGWERTIALPERKLREDTCFQGTFSSDGKLFAVGGGLQEPLCIYDVESGNELHRIVCNAVLPRFSPDNKYLLVECLKEGKPEAPFRIFEAESWKEVGRFSLEGSYHYSLAFSPDGKKLACGTSDRSCVVEFPSGRVLQNLADEPYQLSFSPDGKLLAGSRPQHLLLWDAATGQKLHSRNTDIGIHVVVALSPDGKTLATADRADRGVNLWSTNSGRFLRCLRLPATGRTLVSLDYSPDGRTLIVGMAPGGLILRMDVSTGIVHRGSRLAEPELPARFQFQYCHYQVSSDGKRASTLEERFKGAEGYTQLITRELATGKILSEYQLPGQSRYCAWKADGKLVAVSRPEDMTLWDVTRGEQVFHASATHEGPIAATPDFRLIAACQSPGAAKDGKSTVTVRETATGMEVAALAAGRAQHLALASDNRTLVSVDSEFIRVFDLATGQEGLRWTLPLSAVGTSSRSFVTSLRILPDNRRAVTTLADGTGLVWDISKPAPAPLLDAPPSDERIETWCAALAVDDARQAYSAIWRLCELPAGRVAPLLRRQLALFSEVDAKKIASLIADLDSDAFTSRERASKELEKLGGAADTVLRQALEKGPSAEAKRRLEALLARPIGLATTPDARRRVRAEQVFERLRKE